MPQRPPADRRRLILIGSGVLVALLMLVVLLQLDSSDEPTRPVADGRELLDPDAIPAVGRDAAVLDNPVSAGARGWIQIADADGRLAQQYRCERLDPNPDGLGAGWIGMDEPQLEMFLSNGGVVTMHGQRAEMYAPNSALESGSITGGVIIRMFDDIATLEEDPDGGASVEMRTEAASFDNKLGAITCDGAIHMQTREGEFLGREMRVLINDRDGVISNLRITEVDEIRLASSQLGAAVGAPRGASSSAARSHLRTPHPQGTNRTASRPALNTAPRVVRASHRRALQDADDALVFYRLTLHDDVRLVRGRGAAASTITGNRLHIDFTLENGGLSAPETETARASSGINNNDRTCGGGGAVGTAFTMAVLSAMTSPGPRTIAPPRRDDDVVITCSGPLTMEPAPVTPAELRSADDALLTLTGTPVTINDPEQEAVATGATLSYLAPIGRFRFTGSDDHPLSVESPQVIVTAQQIEVTQSTGDGRIDGSGLIRFLRVADDETARGPRRFRPRDERLRVAWRDGVDLAFAPNAADSPTDLGALDSATFIGDVNLHSAARGAQVGDQPVGGIDMLGGRERTTREIGAAEPGHLRAAEMAVVFREATDGELTLNHLLASGDVVVTGDSRTVWTDELDVTFAGTGDGAAALDDDPEVERVIARHAVQLLLEDGQRIFGAELTLEPQTGTALLLGSDARDVRLVDGTHMVDQVRRITIDDRTQRTEIVGPGRFWRFREPVAIAADGMIDPGDLSGAQAAAIEQMRIRWRDGVTIAPATPDGAADADRDAPQLVTFRGDVRVVSPELRFEGADTLTAELGQSTAQGTGGGVRTISASGSILARTVGDPGMLRCETVNVELAQTDAGDTSPRTLIADGAVHVSDDRQDIWANHFTATFRPAAATDADASAPTTETDSPFAGARAELEHVHATGAVQIRLENGERVFADVLDADAISERATLRGDDMLVIGNDFLMRGGESIELDNAEGAYHLIGAGRFDALADTRPLPDVRRPIDRQSVIDATEGVTRSVEATWTDSALVREGVLMAGTETDGMDPATLSSLELRGSVFVVSDPTPLEHNEVTAGSLTLDFVEAEAGRDLLAVLARQNAKIENRTWNEAAPDEKPRVFHIAGAHVFYDQRAMSARVAGAGELLVREAPGSATETESDATLNQAFGRGGASLFRWTQSLTMNRVVDERFRIELVGDVQAVHQAPDGQTSTLTSQRLIASVDRTIDGTVAEPDPDEVRDRSLELGGPVELRRVRGYGGAYIETDRRRVWCDEFDYDLASGIAAVKATPPGRVSIATGDEGRTASAESVLWNMRDDTISIRRGGN